MNKFTMLIGIPGCGKTTWLEDHVFENAVIICADEIRKWATGDISSQSEEVLVWKIILYQCCYFLTRDSDVILDSGNVNTRLRRDFVSKLPLNSIEKHAIVFHVTPEESVKRIQSQIAFNPFPTRADVPEEIVYRNYGDFLYTLRVLEKENWTSIKHVGDYHGGETSKI